MLRSIRGLAAVMGAALLGALLVAPLEMGAAAAAEEGILFPIKLGKFNGPGQLPVGNIPGACVTAYADDDSVLAQHCNDGTGKYDLTLPEGVSFRVHAGAPGYVDAWAPTVGEKGLAVRYRATRGLFYHQSEGLTIYLTPGAAGSIAGRLTDAGGQPIAGATVTISRRRLNASVPWSSLAVTDADGRYRVTNVPPGAFAIVAGDSLPEAPVVVAESAETTYDWQITEPVGVVVVRLRDQATGAPAVSTCPNASLYICATAGEHRLLMRAGARTVRTRDQSRIAQKDPYLNYFHLTDRPYFAAEAPVEVVAGATATVTLEVPPAAYLGVEITGPAGYGQPEACVHAVPVRPWHAPVDSRFFLGEFGCVSTGGHPISRMGPYPVGDLQLFVSPRDWISRWGAQWVGPSGGVGDQRLAKVFTLHQGDNLIDPIKMDLAGRIYGAAWDPVAQRPALGCAQVVPTSPYLDRIFAINDNSRLNRCTGEHRDDPLILDGLGPYDWPVLFTGAGYAPTWSGGVTDRNQAQLVRARTGDLPGFFDMEVKRSAVLTFTPSGIGATVYNARSGDVVREPFAGPVYVKFALGTRECWYRKGGLRRWANAYLVNAIPGATRTIVLSEANCADRPPQLITMMEIVSVPRRVFGPMFRAAYAVKARAAGGWGAPTAARRALVKP